MFFNPLEFPVCLEFPLWLEETAWAEHTPFAMFLIAATHSRVLVELGTFRGVSFCAFCQAVKSLQTETKCYAVDTWQGDAHAGALEDGVLAKLQAHHDPLYSDFSRLVPSTFDEALKNFAPHSIDLLHIDGLHTYEAVKHDYETWLPKMSGRGLVLFHDTNVREGDFGVWKLWSELKEKHPNFEFLHGHGLGVLAVGKEIPTEIKFLFETDDAETKLIQTFFHQLGLRVSTVRTANVRQNEIESLQKYERFVRNSRTLRTYRVFKDEGLKSVIKKVTKTVGDND